MGSKLDTLLFISYLFITSSNRIYEKKWVFLCRDILKTLSRYSCEIMFSLQNFGNAALHWWKYKKMHGSGGQGRRVF